MIFFLLGVGARASQRSKAETRQDAAGGKERLPADKKNWPEPLANQSYVPACRKSISGEPKREGKTVVYDAELSVNAVGSGLSFGAVA